MNSFLFENNYDFHTHALTAHFFLLCCQLIMFCFRISTRNHSEQSTCRLSLFSLEMKQDAAYKWPLRERLPSCTVLSDFFCPSPWSTENHWLRAMQEKIGSDSLSKGGQFLISFSDKQDFCILAFPDIFLTPLFRTHMTAEHRNHSWFAYKELDNRRN